MENLQKIFSAASDTMKIYIVQIPNEQGDTCIIKVTSKDTDLCKTYRFDDFEDTVHDPLMDALTDFKMLTLDPTNHNTVYMVFDLEVDSNIRFLPIFRSFINDTDTRTLVRYATKNIYIAADGFSVNESTLEETMISILHQMYMQEPFTIQISSDILVNNVMKEIRFGPRIEHAKPKKRPVWMIPMKINIAELCSFQTEPKIYQITQKMEIK